MQFKQIFIVFFLLLGIKCGAQTQEPINAKAIRIVRDEWGVPHIYGKTDREVAYGLAWANCEDDFYTVQVPFLAGRGRLGEVLGKRGAALDYIGHLLRARETAYEQYERDLSPDFRQLLEAHLQGINDYAEKYPHEILRPNLFPLNKFDATSGYIVFMSLLSAVGGPIEKVIKNRENALNPPKGSSGSGSNAFAFSPKATTDGATYFAVNSHQPLEGLASWYECHLVSEEGWDMYGGTFPGGCTIFHGINQHLGWAHTSNGPDLLDVYHLVTRGKKYKLDGNWYPLEKRRVWLKVRIGQSNIRLSIPRTVYYSAHHGPAIKNRSGVFAFRFPAWMDIRCVEQWYRMTKTKNLEEFRQTLDMQALPRQNITYADRKHNIYHVENGMVPVRDPHFDYRGVVRGDTSATIWKPVYHPVSAQPQILNPECGYVYNCNHTPFASSSPEDSPDPAKFPEKTMGYWRNNNSRGLRFREWMKRRGDKKVSYTDFLALKYDLQTPDSSLFITSMRPIHRLDSLLYPRLTPVIRHLNRWNGAFDSRNLDCASVLLAYGRIFKKTKSGFRELREGVPLTEKIAVNAAKRAQKHLIKRFRTTNVEFGNVFRHERGNKSLPLWGFPDVMASMLFVPTKNKKLFPGTFKGIVGESHIVLVRYNADGSREVNAVTAYGSSSKPDSPHFTDQMELFARQKTRPVYLDKETVWKRAKKIYHPE